MSKFREGLIVMIRTKKVDSTWYLQAGIIVDVNDVDESYTVVRLVKETDTPVERNGALKVNRQNAGVDAGLKFDCLALCSEAVRVSEEAISKVVGALSEQCFSEIKEGFGRAF